MKPNYTDIIKAAGEPLWFDENGVPRYVEYSPVHLANSGACECALLTIQCQCCRHQFKVAKSWSKYDWIETGIAVKKLTEGNLEYGDPPNIRCCSSGHTMSSELLSINSLLVRNQATYVWEPVSSEVCKNLYDNNLINRASEDDDNY